MGEPTADELDVRVRGELDMSTAPELSAALVKAGEGASGPIKLDLSGVTFLDSSAIGALISAGQELSASGRSLHIGKRSAIVSRVLEITGLTEDSDAFHVLPDEG
ncbi:MAG TPA: STAS domain-containing protein [Acidimicrobiales bacterium]